VFDSISVVLDNGVGNGAVYLFPPEGVEYTYVWSNGGSSNSIVNVVAGEYYVTITDGSGCMQILSFEVLLNTGVHDEHTVEVSIRPNPANDFLFLDFLPAINEAQIRIISIDGREYWSEDLYGAQTHAIPVSHLPSAIYICMIRTQSEMRMIKFVKS
jgi:hypothetical protein